MTENLRKTKMYPSDSVLPAPLWRGKRRDFSINSTSISCVIQVSHCTLSSPEYVAVLNGDLRRESAV